MLIRHVLQIIWLSRLTRKISTTTRRK